MSLRRKDPVLLHIQDAESWLARAKSSYHAANEIRGELDLSLAQAELRYAWELSRKRSGKGSAASKPNRLPSIIRRWLPLAAAFTFFLALILVAQPWQRPPHRDTPLAIANPPAPGTETAVATGSGPVSAPAAPSSASSALTAGRERPVRRTAPAGTPSETSPVVTPQPAAISNGPVEKGGETGKNSSADYPPVASPSEPLQAAPVREEPLPPAVDLKPAAQLGFELGELERVAKETLIRDNW